jgi:hypothetical protein
MGGFGHPENELLNVPDGKVCLAADEQLTAAMGSELALFHEDLPAPLNFGLQLRVCT